MEHRVLNFGAGPGALPVSVLQQTASEMLSFRGTGMSVGEISHRSKPFMDLMVEAEKDLRTLLSVPANYKVLFMAGGGTTQFAAVPLNLFRESDDETPACTYLMSGSWSKLAAAEAKKFGPVKEVSEWQRFTCSSTRYVFACTNETVAGVFFDPVDALHNHNQILIADMSSEILTRSLDVSRYGLIFAGAQKNIGIPGVTVVIMREDLLGSPAKHCPTALDYTVTAKNGSLYNTPPTTAIYTAGLVFKWALEQGGITALEAQSREKAEMVYTALETHSAVYTLPVPKEYRSRTNVVFRCADEATDKRFIELAEEKHKMVGLAGHRSVGGMRASLYNALPLEHVKTLVAFILAFGHAVENRVAL
jgi:phosphoserine aminotransferase